MKNREYRKWIIKLRRERRAARLLARELSFRTVNVTTYSNDKLVPNTVNYGGGTTKFYKYDRVQMLKSPKKGDHHTPTLYTAVTQELKGCNVLSYRWYYDKYTAPEQHTSGFKTIGLSASMGANWDGVAAGQSLRTSLLQQAQIAINNKVLNGFPSWDVLTDCAELSESVNTLKDCGTKLVSAAGAILRRDPKAFLIALGVKPTRKRIKKVRGIITHHWDVRSSGSVLDCISNIWMQGRYGVMPMVYSMKDAVNALSNFGRDKSLWYRYQVTIPGSYFNHSAIAWSNVVGLTGKTCADVSISASCRIACNVQYRDGLQLKLASYPPLDVVRTGYELIPFSWMLDWFYDIGGWLQQLKLEEIVGQTTARVCFKGTYRTVSYYSDISPGQNYRYSPVQPGFTSGIVYTSKKFDRAPTLLAVPTPSLENGLYKWKRQLDSSAVVWQKARGLMDKEIPRIHKSKVF